MTLFYQLTGALPDRKHARRGSWQLPVLVLILAVVPALAAMPVQASGGGSNTLTLTISAPTTLTGPAGTSVTVSGSNWTPNTSVTIKVGSATGNCSTPTSIPGATGTADSNGAVQVNFAWPSLPNGSYPLCGFSPGVTNGIVSGNLFTETGQAVPTLALPATAPSGGKITITGANWQPSGTQVEILTGPQGSNGCATSLITLTSQSDGTLNGSFTAPTVTKTAAYTVVAVSPVGTCSGSVSATLRATAPISIIALGTTPTPNATGTGHPATATPVSPNGNPGPNCAPNSSSCNAFGGIPWWVICLILLLLLLLFLLLLWLLARRRKEVIITEQDITGTIDPDSVAPLGNMRFIRTVRVTTQTVDRATGTVQSTQNNVFDEFADASGGTRRRPRT